MYFEIVFQKMLWDKKNIYMLFLSFYMFYILNLLSTLIFLHLRLVTSPFCIKNNKLSQYSLYFGWT